MRLPKEAVGRRVDILLQNIPTLTLKVTSIDDLEVRGNYSDDEEWHLNAQYIMAWTYTARQGMSDETKAKIKRSKQLKTTPEQSKSNDLGPGGIIYHGR